MSPDKTSVLPPLPAAIAAGMADLKGRDIVILDLRALRHAVCDWFVIASASSTTNLEAMADSVEEEVRKQLGDKPWRREGRQQREWIILDYVSVVAHIFLEEPREFYGLEDLWGDAPRIDYEPEPTSKGSYR